MEHEQTQQATTSTPLAPAAQSQTVEGTAFRPESIQNHTPGSEDNNGGRDTRPVTSSTERHLRSAPLESHENPLADFERVPPPLPARSRDGHTRRSTHRHGLISTFGNLTAPQNGLDWIVPVNEKDHTRRTLGERLQPTLENAEIEREKYAKKALWTGYALNIAIGLQVLLGALTTGLAAAVTNGRQAQVSTSILGGLATLVASYLARARGSGEPELSITRVKDLEQFLRECKAFQLDHAHEYGSPENGLDYRLWELRRRFEELLGNANGERKLSPVGITANQSKV